MMNLDNMKIIIRLYPAENNDELQLVSKFKEAEMKSMAFWVEDDAENKVKCVDILYNSFEKLN